MEILNDECPCSVNEAELFDAVPKQVVLESTRQSFYTPVTSLTSSSGVIEFSVDGSNDEFIDLNDTELVLEVKVLNSEKSKDLKAEDVIAPMNNWLHTMFSEVQLEIQNKVVEGGQHLYAYKAYLYNLLSHNKSTKETQLVNSGWFKDTASAINTSTNNAGFTSRQALITGSKTVQLGGPILLDMFLQNRYLLPKTSFKLSLTRMKPEFQFGIHTANDVEGKASAVIVDIVSATLHIRKVQALASYIQTIEDNLITQNALYPIQRTIMNTFTIASGLQSYNCQSLFTGQLPKLVFLGFVRNDAYNGSYQQNPFNFQHFNIKSLSLTDSSNTATFVEFKPDFKNRKVAREYNALFKAMGIYNQSESFDITLNEFMNGYTIFGFNLTPDQHASGHQQISRNATVRLDISFSTNTDTGINLIAMGVFDGRIQITKDRTVLCDWTS